MQRFQLLHVSGLLLSHLLKKDLLFEFLSLKLVLQVSRKGTTRAPNNFDRLFDPLWSFYVLRVALAIAMVVWWQIFLWGSSELPVLLDIIVADNVRVLAYRRHFNGRTCIVIACHLGTS